MSARRPRPVRKPVARTPVWVAPAAIVAGLAVLVAAFLVIRWYVTPLPPKAPSQEATVQIVSTITTLPASEFDSVGQGTANNLNRGKPGLSITGRHLPKSSDAVELPGHCRIPSCQITARRGRR